MLAIIVGTTTISSKANASGVGLNCYVESKQQHLARIAKERALSVGWPLQRVTVEKRWEGVSDVNHDDVRSSVSDVLNNIKILDIQKEKSTDRLSIHSIGDATDKQRTSLVTYLSDRLTHTNFAVVTVKWKFKGLAEFETRAVYEETQYKRIIGQALVFEPILDLSQAFEIGQWRTEEHPATVSSRPCMH